MSEVEVLGPEVESIRQDSPKALGGFCGVEDPKNKASWKQKKDSSKWVVVVGGIVKEFNTKSDAEDHASTYAEGVTAVVRGNMLPIRKAVVF